MYPKICYFYVTIPITLIANIAITLTTTTATTTMTTTTAPTIAVTTATTAISAASATTAVSFLYFDTRFLALAFQ